MNTNQLKKFAQAARVKLIEQVTAKLDYVLTHDTAELRGRADTVNKLRDEINAIGKPALIDKVAYTWFNRFIALRFMDANGFQPLGYNVVTAHGKQVSPQILDEAHAGHISEELVVDKNAVMDLLDGRVPSGNPDNDAYRLLLVASCNHLSSILPFLFERINDYTELLLPDDLTSNFSIVNDVVDGMGEEDCKEVEIIGWLYQFYISQRKDEVFASKKAVQKEDIPAATQLFTPRWIVEYMVQNTLGKLWLQNRPGSRLKEFMPYYIESPSSQSKDYLKVSSVEDIKMLDQACGSGHILVYGFELLTKIYEEEGYNSSDIPQLIIEKNLYGFEIDERAAQLAGMALMMKARGYYRRFFKKEIKPNILCFKDLKLKEEDIIDTFKQVGLKLSDELNEDLNNMLQATNFGSLVIPNTTVDDLKEVLNTFTAKQAHADLFLKHKIAEIIGSLDQLILLGSSFHCVVDNPPYMGGGKMNKSLSSFVKANYADSKSDLMACFIESGINSLKELGYLGMINQQAWLFLDYYKSLRKYILENVAIENVLLLGSGAFEEINGEVVKNVAFVLKNVFPESSHEVLGFKLDDAKSSEDKRQLFIQSDAIYSKQSRYQLIPDSAFGFWFSDKRISLFKLFKPLSDFADVRAGLQTGDNERFIRTWYEVKLGNLHLNNTQESKSKSKWFVYNKGGSYRKWMGNKELVVNWYKNGEDIIADKLDKLDKGLIFASNSKPKNTKYYFRQGITWSTTGGKAPSFRLMTENELFDIKGSSVFPHSEDEIYYLLGVLNTKISEEFIKVLSPNLDSNPGYVAKIPLKVSIKDKTAIDALITKCIEITRSDWDSRENSSNFLVSPLIAHRSNNDISESYELFELFCRKQFAQLHSHENELNGKFIEIYELVDELKPNVPLEDITILKEETSIVNGQLDFHIDEIFKQFISYAVGCIFGRYSLDIKGLVLANSGETIDDYLKKITVQKLQPTFVPDEDNIIPILDDEWFEDDIANRFHEFIRASFGEKDFRKNLAFVEECLGRDIRKYFTKDFYKDHIQRYKKRPIYWMFSSPKGYFNVLIYMHRYTPDTLNIILNSYLREFIEKLELQRKQMLNQEATGSVSEQNKARKQIDKIDAMLADCRQYELEILYPLASERIEIDLDDGVLVNYNKFGKAIALVDGLNDAKTKKKVKEFDWIDTSKIK